MSVHEGTMAGPGTVVPVAVGSAHPDTSKEAALVAASVAASERLRVLADIAAHGPAPAGIVADRCGLVRNQVAIRCQELREGGWLERRRGPDRRFERAPTGPRSSGAVHYMTDKGFAALEGGPSRG